MEKLEAVQNRWKVKVQKAISHMWKVHEAKTHEREMWKRKLEKQKNVKGILLVKKKLH